MGSDVAGRGLTGCSIPRGMTTVQFDLEQPVWDRLLVECDLVHARALFGSIQNSLWPNFYRNVFSSVSPARVQHWGWANAGHSHLTEGTGHLEQVEMDWVPRWDESGEVPRNSALQEWADRFLAAMDRCNRSVRIRSHETRHLMEQAGFVDVEEQTIRCYVNPWSSDVHEQEKARWFNLGLGHSLDAMGLMPMVEQLGMTPAEVRDLCSRAVEENTKLRFHGYCTM